MDNQVYCAIANASPLVVIVFDYYDNHTLKLFAAYLHDREIIIFVQVAYAVDEESIGGELARQIKAHQKRCPLHDVYVFANAAEEVETLAKFGIQSFLGNHNSFVDPRLFRVSESSEKEFDSVYVGSLVECKRYELCRDIESVALVYYPHIEDYLASLKREVPSARFINEEMASPPDKFVFLSQPQVVDILNRSRVGLCLSDVEGAMYASIEYLLSGLPVVTTPSRGGRDFFFHSDFVEYAEPTPEAVAAAVKRIQMRAIPAQEIRARTIAAQQRQIDAFISFVDRIVRKNGGSGYKREDWDTYFFHKMTRHETIETFLTKLPPLSESKRGVANRMRRARKRVAGLARFLRRA